MTLLRTLFSDGVWAVPNLQASESLWRILLEVCFGSNRKKRRIRSIFFYWFWSFVPIVHAGYAQTILYLKTPSLVAKNSPPHAVFFSFFFHFLMHDITFSEKIRQVAHYCGANEELIIGADNL